MNTLENSKFHKTLLEAPGNFCLCLIKFKKKWLLNFIRLVPERSPWPEMGEWVFEASKLFFLFCHLEPWHWYGRANSTLLIPSHDSYVWLKSLSMLSTAISTYRLNCHSVAPRRRDRNREAYYTLLDLYYLVFTSIFHAKWDKSSEVGRREERPWQHEL